MILRQRTHHSGKPDTWRYTWDSQDRLISVQTPDGTIWSYRYDPLGRRIGKYRHATDGNIAERFDFSWNGFCLVETLHWNSDGTLTATTWDYRPDALTPITQTDRSWLATASQTEIDFRFHTIITDLVGTPTRLVTPDGDTAWHAQATIWGTTTTTSGQGLSCPLRFPGQYHDQESGYHYNNQRYYDPGTGQYLSKDPLGLEAGSQLIGYVPNPTVQIDPLGLEAQCPRVSRQKQAQHVFGTEEYGVRVQRGTPTSSFSTEAEANAYAQHAWEHGTPVPGQPNVRDYEYNTPVGRGPRGGWQTRVRVHSDNSNRIHAHPAGR